MGQQAASHGDAMGIRSPDDASAAFFQRPNYSLLEVLTGKGPCMGAWATLATNQMETKIIILYLIVMLFVYFSGLNLKLKSVK